jgi:hypothetical protein
MRTAFALGNHAVSTYDDASIPGEPVLAVCSKLGNVIWVDIGPPEQFRLPLHDGHGAGTKYEDAFFDSAGGGNADECFTGAAREHNNPGSCSAIAWPKVLVQISSRLVSTTRTKEFCQRFFLVWAYGSRGFEVNNQIGVSVVRTKVVPRILH